MSAASSTKPDTEASLYAGAAAAAIVALLPYVNVFVFPAYVVGALVAVWHGSRRGGQDLHFKDGARLGFLSPFLGSMVAVVLADLIWVFFDYQLWQRQNESLMLGLFRSFASPATVEMMKASFAENAVKLFRWYMLLVQLLANAIFSGIFGTLAGLLGVKIFRSRPVR